jgi:hypothetical protein
MRPPLTAGDERQDDVEKKIRKEMRRDIGQEIAEMGIPIARSLDQQELPWDSSTVLFFSRLLPKIPSMITPDSVRQSYTRRTIA